MTEKRFTIIDGIKKGTHSGIWDNQKQHNQGIGDELWLGEVVAMLNEGVMIVEENEQLKADNNRLVNETARIVAEHQSKVFDLIDEKIEHYQKQPILAVRISTNCEHRKSCLHNHEVNVCNKAKENAYRELKKELQE